MARRPFDVPDVVQGMLTGAALFFSVSLAGAQNALVYARDPVQTPQPALVEMPLAPDGPALRHPRLNVHSCIDAGAHGTLPAGQTVRTCSMVQSATPDALGAYTAAPLSVNAPPSAADPFAEQMLFYHGARTLQYFSQLGLADVTSLQLIANVRLPAAGSPQPWRDASFVRANEDAGALAALHTRGVAAVYFGQDHAVRVAYDSAAIRHEVSHAALASLLPREEWRFDTQGSNSAPAAIAEALADYFAAVIADDPRVGAYAGHGTAESLTRNLSAPLACPAALSGAAHQTGLLIASALWAARKELGATLDSALVSALRKQRAAPGLTVEKLLQEVLDALGAEQPAAATIFRDRGLLPTCERVLDLRPEQSLSGQSGRLVLPAATPARPLASSIVQLRAAVPAGTTRLELRMRAEPQHELALLVSAKPIRWTTSGRHNAKLVTASEPASSAELRFSMPVHTAGMLYFQVVNRAQRQGWFDTVRLIARR